MLAAVSLTVFTLLLNAAIHFTGLERNMYYRPSELMKASDPNFGSIYKPNTQFSMMAQFGDLEAIESVGVKEPHEIAYHTDNLGFRNPSNYHGQEFVLVGDSFVAGFTDTQSCILTEWLRRDHKLDTYNLGFPGDLNDYVNRVMAFRKIQGNNFRVALFVFEGNDFGPFTHQPYAKHTLLGDYYAMFKGSSLWHYTHWLYLRGIEKRHKSSTPQNMVEELGGKPVIFSTEDKGRLIQGGSMREDDMKFASAFEMLKPNLAEIFFVPVKYRVYAPLMAQEIRSNVGWDYLARAANQAGVPVHDLTPVLQAEAARLLPQGQYVYWRDDSHWNCNGMRVAAAEVARVLNSP